MISEIIEKWIKGILIDGITGNLSGLFDNVNAKVGEIASDVGSTPQAWNSGIFNMLRSLSETVVLPIAAAILALVMCHEFIQMITEKNNMHDFDTSMFFRWIFKSAFAILIVSNTWNIVMGVFDATQSVVNQSSGVIIGETSIHFDRLIPGLEFQLESMTIGSLLSLWFQTLVVGLTMNILSIALQQVDAAPDTQGTAQTDHDRLQSIDCAVEKFHKVLTFCRLFCGTQNCFFKKYRLIRRLHLHPTGRFRTGQNFRPVRPLAAASGAGWIRTCPHQRCFSCPRPQGTCSAGAW